MSDARYPSSPAASRWRHITTYIGPAAHSSCVACTITTIQGTLADDMNVGYPCLTFVVRVMFAMSTDITQRISTSDDLLLLHFQSARMRSPANSPAGKRYHHHRTQKCQKIGWKEAKYDANMVNHIRYTFAFLCYIAKVTFGTYAVLIYRETISTNVASLHMACVTINVGWFAICNAQNTTTCLIQLQLISLAWHINTIITYVFAIRTVVLRVIMTIITMWNAWNTWCICMLLRRTRTSLTSATLVMHRYTRTRTGNSRHQHESNSKHG